MKVAVTGAAGFIGSYLCERLVQDGHYVVGLDNFDPFYARAAKERNLESRLQGPRFVLVEGDIRDPGSLRRLLEGTDTVVHLAARAGIRPSFEEPTAYADVNVRGTQLLLQEAERIGVARFVFGSSSSVYGKGAPHPFREDGDLGTPASPYASTKVAGELLCRNFESHFESVVVLRFFTAYGPRQRPDLAIHKFARLLTAGEPLPIYGSLSTFRDYTYVDDIVNGVSAAVTHAGVGYDVFNLGSGNPTRLSDLIRLLDEVFGVETAREQLPAHEGDLRGTWADVTKAKDVLCYEPRWTLDAGLRSFAEWFTTSLTRS